VLIWRGEADWWQECRGWCGHWGRFFVVVPRVAWFPARGRL
jgi:hypothetical protein